MLAVFLDIETTGLDPGQHVPIEIAFIVVDMTDGTEKFVYQSVIRYPFSAWERRDPQSIQVNGFTWDEVETGKSPEEVGQEIVEILGELGIKRESAVFVCQNPSFDRGFFGQLVNVYRQQELSWPYHWLDFASMYWALLARGAVKGKEAFPKSMSLSKNAIAQKYGIPPEEQPHRAMNGVKHLLACYRTAIGIPQAEPSPVSTQTAESQE